MENSSEKYIKYRDYFKMLMPDQEGGGNSGDDKEDDEDPT